MSRVEHLSDSVTLHLGDCREILPSLGKVDAVVTDPPYGMSYNTNSRRFTKTVGDGGESLRVWDAVVGDDKPFDPAPFEVFPKRLFWGANHFAARLPIGTTLVWIKKSDLQFGTFLSDAELAWMAGGHGVYCKRDMSLQATEREQRQHPTQKPIAIMVWCIEKIGPAETILDPFMGSGTTGVAAVKLGRKFIGIEIEPKYFDIACRRIADQLSRPMLALDAPQPKPQALTLL